VERIIVIVIVAAPALYLAWFCKSGSGAKPLTEPTSKRCAIDMAGRCVLIIGFEWLLFLVAAQIGNAAPTRCTRQAAGAAVLG